MEDNFCDSELIEKVKNSDMDAFNILFKRYQPILFRKVFYCTKDHDLSNDIVQDTFIKMWNKRESLKPSLSILAYLLHISKNLIIDYYRHLQIVNINKNIIPAPSLSETDNPSNALDLTLLQEQLDFIIKNKLPDRCKDIFILSRFEGKSNSEIASLLKISVKTVENQITKALKIIKKNIVLD